MKVNIITMGCSKNLVDSERVASMMEANGIETVHNADNFSGDAVVINTCGFIGDAKEESIEMILSACRAKEEGSLGKVVVMGCLSQRYRDELKKEIPEVDLWFGKFDWQGVAKALKPSATKKIKPTVEEIGRRLSTPGHYAYLKISEGCNRFCSFCAIPLITGRHKSRSMEDIESEARRLVSRGVKEINVIAQDLSSYGRDLYGNSRLAELTRRLSDIEGLEFIRLHYAYPADFPPDVLDVMRERENVCNYLDIALQHADDRVLENMRRHINLAQTEKLLYTIRERVPGIHIRTTMMTGFPGEDERAFNTLLDFVKRQRFERLGAFAYSEEEGTYGALHFEDTIPQDVKQRRLDKLMEIQEEIAEEINASKIGTSMKAIVDEIGPEVITLRSQYDSPEVDPVITVRKTPETSGVKVGDIVKVTITGYESYDLTGEII